MNDYRKYRCHRCNRQPNARNFRRWNGTFKAGRLVNATCPKCQTHIEDLEAAVNEATSNYHRSPGGLFFATPKQGGGK